MYSKPTFGSKKELACRWEDRTELFIDKNGQERTSRARIFLAESVDLDGYLYLGHTDETSPLNLTDAFEIRSLKTTPDLRNLKQLFVAYL
jgi:hypothetical protein